MKFVSVLSFAPIFAALVSAAPTPASSTLTTAANENAGLAITNPIQSTSAIMGTTFNIKWTQTDPTATKIQSIALMAGDSSALVTIIPNVLNIQSIDISSAGYNWTVPSNLTSRQDYALAIKGDNTFTTYSSYFSILPSNTTESAGSSAADTSLGDDSTSTDESDADESEDVSEDVTKDSTEEVSEESTDDAQATEESTDDAQATEESTDDAQATEESTDETADDASESS
ncbi:hypothetical protein EDC96DRAFT_532697 [Choanephora cucurbitarum]|nr:hypothetical protein EDC96DRAFT_532697 [Choanephora cucurbitarum]